MKWYKQLYLVTLITFIHYQTSSAFNHTLFVPRKTVFNILNLSLGLTGIYGLILYLHNNTIPKQSSDTTKTERVAPIISTTCILISILALIFPPAWAQ